MSEPIPQGQPTPGTPESIAQEKVAAVTIDLMLGSAVPPHVIAAALLANLTLVLCSASPDVSTAHKALNQAAAVLKHNKRLAPGLLRTARTAQHAATASGATAGMASGKVQ